MPIGDYCQKPAATISSDETVRAAAQRMAAEGLGTLVVLEDDRPTGIATDRDIVLETLSRRLDAGSVHIGEIASHRLVTIDQKSPVREAVQLMRHHTVRRLPVIDDKGQLVGIVAADDLLSLAAAELSNLAVAIGAQSPRCDLEGTGS